MFGSRSFRVLSLFGALALGACSGAGEDVDLSADELNPVEKGAGAGVPVWDSDPCAAPAAYAKANGYNLIVANVGEHVIHGTPGRDLIVGTGGDDHIWGGAGADVICAGYGEDYVHGDNRDDNNPGNDANDGPDYIDGGGDNDHLFGDGGEDVIHGRGGSDYIFGGGGDDILLGDILDDHLFGEDGDDLLIGGHGTDIMMGGPGNDYLRGDTGNDAFLGGPGQDVASFITAMPPGQGQRANEPEDKLNGVKVDFSNDCAAASFAKDDVGGKTTFDGCANGDGGNEPVDSIEVVVGSPYNDVFVSGSDKVHFVKGYGDDRCDGTPCGTVVAAGTLFVALDTAARDTGAIVIGTSGTEILDVFTKNKEVHVRSLNSAPLATALPCTVQGNEVVCPVAHTLRYIAAYLGDALDIANFGSSVSDASRSPRDITIHASGGPGNDYLHGGDEQDVLFTGVQGEDHLFGNEGDDALLSESRKWPAMDCSKLTNDQRDHNPRCTEDKPDGASYDDGSDELYGGPGDDQLVTDYPCGKHKNSGGPGKDIAGFARSGRFDLNAQLAGAASVDTAFHGKAYNPQLCGVAYATMFLDSLEILEAADGDDTLYGNNDDNVIWGREGDDHIHGLEGDDILAGLLGNDTLYGGGGNDVFTGGEQVFPNAD
ncbi:hypothetical protein BH09MYX1_BH09MYX1_35400 [soil metagenome]